MRYGKVHGWLKQVEHFLRGDQYLEKTKQWKLLT
jgi:hypothetical protein